MPAAAGYFRGGAGCISRSGPTGAGLLLCLQLRPACRTKAMRGADPHSGGHMRRYLISLKPSPCTSVAFITIRNAAGSMDLMSPSVFAKSLRCVTTMSICLSRPV